MAAQQPHHQIPERIADAQLARVASDGCESDAYLNRLLDEPGPHYGRDLADAVHLLCALHGQYPGLIAIALRQSEDAGVRAWLDDASTAFEEERAFLLRLTAAVGPIPSTPAAAETEASLSAARHALETLACSERAGCALGAATALAADWRAIRRLLDRAAARCGLEGPVLSLPATQSIASTIDRAVQSPAAARALAFGAEQLLLQHRALFALLEARAEARGPY